MTRSMIPTALVAITGMSLLTACTTVGPDYTVPDLVEGDARAVFLGEGDPLFETRPAAQAWWVQIGDEDLTWLIEEATRENYDLQAAAANLRGARALLRQEETGRRPGITATGSVAGAQESNAVTGTPNTSADLTTPTALSLDLAWELDLFGRIDRLVEAADANVGEAEALRQDAMRIVAADVALAYVDLREAQLRLTIAEENLATQTETVEITQILTEAGRISDIDLVRARALQATTAASIPGLRAGETAARNRLATLLGRPPGGLDKRLTASKPLPDLPDFVAVGDPGDLLRRRPDIKAAERALARDTAAIGVATADLFPRVTLGGGIGLSAADIGDITSTGAPGFSLGPSLSWNVFDRGAIYARIEQSEAGAAVRLARYRQTVLIALEETETAMSNLVEERLRLASLAAAAENSAQAAELALIRYEAGSEAFISVLDAQRSQLAADDQQAASRANVSRSLILLYRALGGGWDAA